MDIGRLRRRVTLQSPSGARDAVGERVTVWGNVATVWASVEPLSARELFLAGQAQLAVSLKVVIRYSSTVSSIDASWRVLFGSRILVIEGVRNIGERNEMIELLCSEGLAEE